MATGAVVARIISQYSDKGSKAARRDIAKLGNNFDKFAKKATKAFAIAGAASAAFAVKIGIDAVQAAIQDQKSQALLANSLRNTVGATDSAIAAVEKYITKQQALYSVADDKLRPSLAALVAATGSVTEAQKLQGVALDIAADKQIDLVAASKLLAKANGGNIGALKKLYPEISAVTVKSKDFAGALDMVSKISGGAAAASADTLAMRLEGLKLAYGEVLETLGYALLPVITEFVTYIQGSVLPALEAWTSVNKDKIAASLKQTFEVLKSVVIQLGEFFGFISRNIGTLKVFGAVLAGIFVGGKIAAGIQGIVAGIGLITTALTMQTAAASTAAIAMGFVTLGASVIAGAAAAVQFYKAMGKVQSSVEGANGALATQTGAMYGLRGAIGIQEKSLGVVVKLTKAEIAAANAAKAATKAAAVAAKKKADSLKAIAALTSAGAKPTSENDPIQLEAARLNLIKQGALAEQARFTAFVNARKFEIDANNAATESAKRYNDILTVLADAKISPAEFEVLAAKWGTTTNAAQLYVQTIISIRDNDVSAAEVAKLAETWGVTYKQASTYLDFFAALNDGTLSDAEIGKLQEKWGLTKKEVSQYSDAFLAADDGKIDLTEITALANKWGMTKAEAEAYAKKILEKFGFDTTLLEAPISAKDSWTAAYGGVLAYKAISEGTFTYDPSITAGADVAAGAWKLATDNATAYKLAANAASGIVIQAPVFAGDQSIGGIVAAAEAAATAAAQAAAAAAESVSSTQEVIDAIAAAAASTAATVTGGNSGSSSTVSPLPHGAIPAKYLAKGGIVTSPTLSVIGEAGPEAVIPLSQMGSMGGGSNITINVGGSVISEGDLVAVIRDQLLGLQLSGKSISLSAISI